MEAGWWDGKVAPAEVRAVSRCPDTSCGHRGHMALILRRTELCVGHGSGEDHRMALGRGLRARDE